MRFKKQIIILLVIFMIVNTSTVGIAKANSLAPYLNPTYYTGTSGAGMTAGGMLGVLGGLMASIWQVDLIVDNWDMFTDYLGNMVRFGEDWSSRLWDQVSGIFIHKDTGKTLEQAAADGDNINYYDFYAPNEVGRIKLDITEDMLLEGAGTLADIKGLESINPEFNTLIGRVHSSVVNHLIKNNPLYQPFTFQKPEWLAYENVVMIWDDATRYLTFYCWNNQVDRGLKAYVVGDYIHIKSPSSSRVDMYRISFRQELNSYGNHYENKDEYVNFNVSGNRLGTYSDYIDLGKYSSNVEIMSAVIPFDLIGQNLKLHNTPLNIDASRYDVDDTWQNGISININDYLVQELEKLGGFDRLTSTDDLMQVMEKADARARENYDRILPRTVVDTSVPGIDIPILSDIAGIFQNIWEWLQNLWDGFATTVEGVLNWAFIPDQARIQEKVNGMVQSVENNSNIVTYPLELIIMYMNRLNSEEVNDFILNFPALSWHGNSLFGGYSINITDLSERQSFQTMISYSKMLTSAMIIVSFVNLSIQKGKSIGMGG